MSASPPAPLLSLLFYYSPPSAGGLVAAGYGSAATGYGSVATGYGFSAPAPATSYYEANIAYCIAVSSSSAPASKRKFAAYSRFLSHAKYASAALYFGNPYETNVLISSISCGLTYIEPGGACYCPPGAGGPPAIGFPPMIIANKSCGFY